jgi:lipoprotein-releasing system ATP-binding protein
MIRHSFWSWWSERRSLRRRGAELLERVGLSHRIKHRPRELSGGEMQRAAIARALINRPRILLADEPTGNLDAKNGAHVMSLLRDLNREDGVTIVMVTHNLDLVAESDRVIRLTDGLVEKCAEPLFADMELRLEKRCQDPFPKPHGQHAEEILGKGS